MRQLAARGQRLVEAGGGVDAFEPVVEQRLQAGVVQAQQVRQARQRAVRVGDGGRRRRIEGQPRRRRVGGEGAHRLEPAHLQRVQALAQRGFQRGFPAGLDVHLGPQALQAVQPVLGQPGLELAARSAPCPAARAAPPAARPGRPGARLRRLPPAACARRCSSSAGTCSPSSCSRASASAWPSFGGGAVALQLLQPLQVGRGQALALAAQPLAALLQLARLLVDVAALGGQHLDLLLHLGHRAALLVAALPARRARASSSAGQLLRLLLGLRGLQLRPAPRPRRSASAMRSSSASRLGLALRPIGRSAPSARPGAACDALAAFDHVADALFEPAHLQRGLGQLALRARAARRRRRSAPGARSPARPRRGAARPRAPPARWWPRAPRHARAASSLGRVAVLEEPELVQLQRALLLQRAVRSAPPRPASPASRGWRSARAGCRRRASGSRACPSAGSRSRGGAPCTWRRRRLLRGTGAAPRAAIR